MPMKFMKAEADTSQGAIASPCDEPALSETPKHESLSAPKLRRLIHACPPGADEQEGRQQPYDVSRISWIIGEAGGSMDIFDLPPELAADIDELALLTDQAKQDPRLE